jgi:predicted phage replisome organizer
MKKLRRIAGGDTYTIIYLKLQLLSLKDEGLLYYEGVEPTFYEEMALALDEDAENVRATLIFLENMGLISRNNEHEYILTEVPYLIGSETDKAELMRKKRERERLQSSNNVTAVLPPVTNCYTEIEIDKDIDIDIDIEKDIELEKSKSKREKTPPKETKHKYGEYNNVLLTDTELEKLKAEYTDYEARIDRLSGYIESKGAKYKSHYATIRNWARKDAEQGKAKSTKAQELDNFYSMASEWAESED